MGLAASQARLLSLTARMHDIEYKAQKLEAQKLQMANKSTQVYNEYEAALNEQKIQYKIIGADGSASYKDATVKDLVTATGEAKSDYIMHNIATNQMYCTKAQIEAFNKANNATVGGDGKYTDATYKQNDKGEYVNAAGQPVADQKNPAADGVVINAATENATTKAELFAKLMGDELGASSSYQTLFKEMQECVAKHGNKATDAFIAVDVSATETDKAKGADYKPTADEAKQFSSSTYLTNMINEGFIVLHKMTGDNITGAADEVNVATDAALQQVSDETKLKKAEAKYEADMAKINAKDKKFDTDIAALEQERNAIKTEIDTLKTVAKDNVERTFKLFS